MKFEEKIYLSNLIFMIVPLLIITVTVYLVGVDIFKDQMHERNLLVLQHLSGRIGGVQQVDLPIEDGILLLVDSHGKLHAGMGNGFQQAEFENFLQNSAWEEGKQGEKYNVQTGNYYLYYQDGISGLASSASDLNLLYFRPRSIAEASLFKFRSIVFISFVTLLFLALYLQKLAIKQLLKPVGSLAGKIRTVVDRDVIASLRLIEKDEIQLINKYLGEVQSSLKEQDAKMRKHLFNVMDVLIDLLEIKDSYTASHSKEVRKYSIAIAQTMGLPEQEIRDIAFAATLHDIGKIGVSHSILNKPGKLTTQEFSVIQQHPVVADEVLKNIEELDYIRNIVRHHHEKYDGSGYPDGLKGADIPLAARIVTVADAFDAMTSDRPYRQAMSFKRAIGILVEEKGTQFDPNVVDALVTYIYRQNLYEKEVAAANE